MLKDFKMFDEEWLSISCDDCGIKFDNLEDFMVHRKIHFAPAPDIRLKKKDILKGVCPHCNLTFYFKTLAPDALEEVQRLRKTKERGQKARKLMECRYCIKCKVSFINTQQFLAHCKETHGLDRPYECTKCNFSTSVYHNLTRHSYVHENIKPYTCHLCPKDYMSQTSLHGHLLTHSEVKIKSHDCEFCGKKYPIPNLLKRHLKTHAALQKVFKCNLCPKEFAYKHSLKLHTLTHTGEKPYRCQICQRGFTQPFHYRHHMQGHNQIIGKVIDCKFCDKQFLTPYLLKQHMIMHNNNKFTCDVCSKPYVRQKNLNLHKKTHTGDVPYNCNDCQKKFTGRWEFNRHRIIHTKPNEDPAVCEHCGKEFTAIYKLERHIKIHTREVDQPYKCEICPKRFTRKQELKYHHQIHEGKEPYACMHCGRKFVKQGLLKSHLNPDRNAEKPFRCKKCTASFSNKNCFTFHNWTHKNKYFCEICYRKFSTAIGLKNHLNQHVKKKSEKSIVKEEL